MDPALARVNQQPNPGPTPALLGTGSPQHSPPPKNAFLRPGAPRVPRRRGKASVQRCTTHAVMRTLRVGDSTQEPGSPQQAPASFPITGLATRAGLQCPTGPRHCSPLPGNRAPGLEQTLMLTLPFQTAPSTSSSFPPSCRRTGSPASPAGGLGRSRMTTAREQERADRTAVLPPPKQQNAPRFRSGLIITALGACPGPSPAGRLNLSLGNSREGGRAPCFSNTSQLMMPEPAWCCALG